MSCAVGGKQQEKTKETNIMLRGLFEDRVEKDAKNGKLKQEGFMLVWSRWMIMEKVDKVRASQFSREIQ